ncbi:MAG: c-type cytochrome [Acidobacteria bacterium]|nr:c-type cytochrome [Acidobacteriota bacterium]
MDLATKLYAQNSGELHDQTKFSFLDFLRLCRHAGCFRIGETVRCQRAGRQPFDTGGRDDKPAEEVFKNVQTLKNMPAGRLVGVMNGWTKALGVKCNHCHTLGAWEKEDEPAKQIARDMVALTSRINGESLKEIKNLKSERPSISCYTCHRGAVKPETAPAPPAQPQ